VHYGRTSGSSLIRTQATQFAVGAAVFGLIMPGIDNYAHAGGLLGGYLVSSFMNPLTRERGDHLVIAFGCLLVSFLAIAYSIVHGLGILR
jgi:rhomboid protease GluP